MLTLFRLPHKFAHGKEEMVNTSFTFGFMTSRTSDTFVMGSLFLFGYNKNILIYFKLHDKESQDV